MLLLEPPSQIFLQKHTSPIGKFRQKSRKNSLTKEVGKHWNKLVREVVMDTCLGWFRQRRSHLELKAGPESLVPFQAYFAICYGAFPAVTQPNPA